MCPMPKKGPTQGPKGVYVFIYVRQSLDLVVGLIESYLLVASIFFVGYIGPYIWSQGNVVRPTEIGLPRYRTR